MKGMLQEWSAGAGTLALASSVFAQAGGWWIEATPVVSPTSPVAEIRVYAWFDYVPDTAELFYYGRFDLTASEPLFIDYLNPPGIIGNDPEPAPVYPSAIPGLRVAQIHAPPRHYADPSNPLLIVVARWRADEFTPRVVTFRAEPLPSFAVYRSYSGITPGSTTIPGPSAGVFQIEVLGPCYADCDTSTGVNVLDIFDFLCFQNRFVAGGPYACDCDTGTGSGVCDIFDFLCFQNEFAAGCP